MSVEKHTMRFPLTVLALGIDPSDLYHILWFPNRLKKMLKTQEIETTLPLDFPE